MSNAVPHHNTPDVFSSGKIGPLTLRNRTIKAATYENMARDGLVTDQLIDFHVEHAAGGVGMTTVAYCAVSREGRTDGRQIYWRQEAMPGLRRLTDAVHAEGAAVSAQIGHAGPVGKPKLTGGPAYSPSRHISPQAMSATTPVSTTELERIVRAHGDAARMAVDAGFDAVEVHLGHNYLASSFLSPKLNRRTDEYGGSLRNRARLALDCAQAVRDAVGDRLAIVAKMNMDDGVPGGFWLDEAIVVSQWLQQAGSVDALEMTAGSSLLNPMYLFKGDVPMEDFAARMKEPVKTGLKLVGNRFLRTYPYEPGYLLEDARQIRAEVDLPMILLGGITDKEIIDRGMSEGFEFVAMARALLREPDLINRMQADASTPSLCNHNNRCMTSIFGSATRCVLAPEQHPANAENRRTSTAGQPPTADNAS